MDDIDSMKKTYLILLLIIILASCLRFFNILKVPPSLYWDEAAIGYNAYSILKTGKDEWGIPFPVLFKSFGDYKAPLYIYIVSLSEIVLGPTKLAVRTPSAVAGIISVLGIFLLTTELFMKFEIKHKDKLALLASFLMATSSWAIQFSRAGFEANVAIMLVIFGVWLFFKAIVQPRLLILSIILFVLSIYAYHSAKIFTPLLVFILIIINWHFLWSKRLIFITSLIVGLIIFLPYIPTYFSTEGRMRILSENVFTLKGDAIKNLVQNYTVQFSSDFLFFKGDQEGRHSVKMLGELYIWQLPFILIGIYKLIKENNKLSVILFSWLLIGAVPAALTRVSPHAVRGMMMLPVWELITVIGFGAVLSRRRLILGLIVIPVIIFSLALYLRIYYFYYPTINAADWQDGQEETVNYLKSVEGKYDRFFLSTDLSYIYLLFYTKYDPARLQRSNHNISVLGKYEYFSSESIQPKVNANEKILTVIPDWMGTSKQTIKDIYMINGNRAFRIYEY